MSFTFSHAMYGQNEIVVKPGDPLTHVLIVRAGCLLSAPMPVPDSPALSWDNFRIWVEGVNEVRNSFIHSSFIEPPSWPHRAGSLVETLFAVPSTGSFPFFHPHRPRAALPLRVHIVTYHGLALASAHLTQRTRVLWSSCRIPLWCHGVSWGAIAVC